jgi:peptide/nickel transport system substrate-binding protein
MLVARSRKAIGVERCGRKFDMRARNAIAGVLLASVVQFGAEAALAQKQGGILKIYGRDNPPSASMHEESTISVTQPFAAIYNGVVMFDQTKLLHTPETIVPDLAKSWEWDATKTKVTFKLNEGVKWHDGKPFTAADVKFTFDMVSGKTNVEDFRKNPRKVWYYNLKEITTNGDHEVTFHLNDPQPSFLMMLAAAFSPVYPTHVPQRDMRTKPVGTGPFKFVEFKRNESIKLTRNPDYFKKGKPYLDGIEMRIIDNRSTRVLAFQAGEFDVTFDSDITVPLMKDMAAQAPKAQCTTRFTNVSINLIINSGVPPFDNEKIRRAMAQAIDRGSFNKILTDGKGALGGAMLPLPDGQWAMPDDMVKTLPGYSPDVEKSQAEARKVMEELGYSATKTLKVKISTRNIAIYRDPAVILIDQLKKIHIEGELDAVDTTIWHAKAARKDYQVGLNLTGIAADDPDMQFIENYSCKSERNYTQYCNPEVEKLIFAQSKITDVETRKKAVWEIERKLVEDVARPIIQYDPGATCWQPHVKGIVLPKNSIYNYWRLEDVWIEK